VQQANPEDPRLILALEESARSISQQQEALNSLHTRAGIVLSAAAIASSLFGAQMLRDDSLSCLSWDALAAFVLAAGASLYVLWPRSDWRFSNSATTLLNIWVDKEDASIDTMRREVAEFNQGAWEDNQKKLGRLYVGFQVASAALGIEVVFWLIDLGTR
jgi:hypothetical protein